MSAEHIPDSVMLNPFEHELLEVKANVAARKRDPHIRLECVADRLQALGIDPYDLRDYLDGLIDD